MGLELSPDGCGFVETNEAPALVCFEHPIETGTASSFAAGLVIAIEANTGNAVVGNPDARQASTGQSTADPVETACILGIVCETPDPGDTSITIASNGEVVLSDWTAATGSVTLTPGLRYYALTSTTTDGRLVAEDELGVHNFQYLVQVGEALSTTAMMVDVRPPIQFVTHNHATAFDTIGPGNGTGANANAAPVSDCLPMAWDPVTQKAKAFHRDRRDMDTRTSLGTELSLRVSGMVWEKTLSADLAISYGDCQTGNWVWLEIDLSTHRFFFPANTTIVRGYHELSPTPTVGANAGQHFLDGQWVDGPARIRFTCTGDGQVTAEVFARPVVTLTGLVDFFDHTNLQTMNQGTLQGHYLGVAGATNSVLWLEDERGAALGDTPTLHGTATPGASVRIEIPGAAGRLPLRWGEDGFNPQAPPNDIPELPPMIYEVTAGPDGVWTADLGPLPNSFQAGWRDRHLSANTPMITEARSYQPIVRAQWDGLYSEYVNDPYLRNANGSFNTTNGAALDHFRFFVWSHTGPLFDPALRIIRDASGNVEDWEPERVDYLTGPYRARVWSPVATERPTYIDSDPDFNGLPVINFDGPTKMLLNNAPVTAPPYHRVWSDGRTLKQSGNNYGAQGHHWEWGYRGHAWYWVIALDQYTGASTTAWAIDCAERDSNWGWTLRFNTTLGVPQLRYRYAPALWNTLTPPPVGPLSGPTPNYFDSVPRLWSLRAIPEYAPGSLEVGAPFPTGNWTMQLEVDGHSVTTSPVHSTVMLPWGTDDRTLMFGMNRAPSLNFTTNFRLGHFEIAGRGDLTDFEHEANLARLRTKFALW